MGNTSYKEATGDFSYHGALGDSSYHGDMGNNSYHGAMDDNSYQGAFGNDIMESRAIIVIMEPWVIMTTTKTLEQNDYPKKIQSVTSSIS